MSDPRGDIALAWWKELQPDAARPDAAALAQLRRCATPVEALMHERALDLARRLGAKRAEHVSVYGEIAAVLAHVRSDSDTRIARALGGPAADKRLMSGLRFRNLLGAQTGAPRMAAFRRAIAMLKGKASVADLTESLLVWDHPDYGERRRIRWMFDYVGASGAETEAANEEAEKELSA